jgi:hypothetical protein
MFAPSLVRREFLRQLGVGSVGAALAGSWAVRAVGGEPAQGQPKWRPLSDRKIRFGTVGFGVCRFGAEFSFQDHPHVDGSLREPRSAHGVSGLR